MNLKTQRCLLVLWIISLSVTDGKWDGLRATWGLNPVDKYNFDTLPRTVANALIHGFRRIDECNVIAKWRGARYMKGDDSAVILLYDVNGFIAGMQTGVPRNSENGYPQRGQMPPFMEDTDDRYVMTVYFVEPSKICTTGRTAIEYLAQGTGTNLYVQNGTDPETDSFIIPKKEQNIYNTKWVPGRCFPLMGNHYWYNISYKMNCHDFFPVFPLYNNGELTAFGFVLMANLQSRRYEKPPALIYWRFLRRVPRCVYFAGRTSSLHVYLTRNVRRNQC